MKIIYSFGGPISHTLGFSIVAPGRATARGIFHESDEPTPSFASLISGPGYYGRYFYIYNRMRVSLMLERFLHPHQKSDLSIRSNNVSHARWLYRGKKTKLKKTIIIKKNRS